MNEMTNGTGMAPAPMVPPAALPPETGQEEALSPAYTQAIESIARVSESSSQLAVMTVERLVRTTAVWIAGLEERQKRLEEEIDARRFELAQLDAFIERERANAEALVQSANRWAEAAQEEISRKRSRVLDDSADLDRRFRVVDESIRGLLDRIQPARDPALTAPAEPAESGALPDVRPPPPDARPAPGPEASVPPRGGWKRFLFGD